MIFVGIDLSDFAVRAAAVKKTGAGFEVVGSHFFPLKPGGEDGEQTDLLKAGHLKTLAGLYQNQDVKYVLSAAQNEISARSLSFPFKESYKIAQSLAFELEDKTLFDCKQLISDFKIIRQFKLGADVLVFSIFRSKIIHALQLLKSVGIEPFILTCEASAVSRLFENHAPLSAEEGPKNNNCCLYLKMDCSRTTALVFQHGGLKDVYNFEWGVLACIKKIAAKYEISLAAAYDQFYEKAFVLTSKRGYTGGQIAFSGVIQEELEFLTDKIRLLLLEINGQKGWKCQKIIVCGGGSQIRNLQAFLSSKWNIPVQRAEKVLNFPLKPSWNLRDNEHHQNDLMTALGAALAGAESLQKPVINFLKEEFAVKWNWGKLWASSKRPRWAAGAACFVLFSVYAYLRHQQAEQLADKAHNLFQQTAGRVAGLRPPRANVKQVRRFIDKRKHLIKQAELAEQIAALPSALDGLKDMSIAVRKQPSWKLEIHKLNITNKQVSIYGRLAPAYLKTLENNLKSMADQGALKTLPLLTQNLPPPLASPSTSLSPPKLPITPSPSIASRFLQPPTPPAPLPQRGRGEQEKIPFKAPLPPGGGLGGGETAPGSRKQAAQLKEFAYSFIRKERRTP